MGGVEEAYRRAKNIEDEEEKMSWWKPEEIREIDFNRSIRGYNEHEVREFWKNWLLK